LIEHPQSTFSRFKKSSKHLHNHMWPSSKFFRPQNDRKIVIEVELIFFKTQRFAWKFFSTIIVTQICWRNGSWDYFGHLMSHLYLFYNLLALER